MSPCPLYNLWIITNTMLSDYLYGEQVEHKIITAKMFLRKFYDAYKEYVP
ncbi:MAG: hypothetical protein KAU24_03315 [Candidatus Aenigmarchaeota archaeon]|nr:hypothetical protein [Candidatus Aenigmarchaeota archaeon]